MRLILILALIGFIQSGSAAASTILVLGDSISAAYGMADEDGWVHLAQKQLQEKDPDTRFVNASISGDTTEGALRRLPDALERFTPDYVVIELGGNDGLRGYSLKKLQQNLETLAAMSQGAGAEVVIVGMRIPSNYGPAYTSKFEQTFVTAAENVQADLIPFMFEPLLPDPPAYFQRDGIHPNEAAQPLLAEHVLNTLLPLMAKESLAQ